jgi:hypothetical protein
MKRIVKQDLLAGFFHPADAIVPCKRCGAVEGVPLFISGSQNVEILAEGEDVPLSHTLGRSS